MGYQQHSGYPRWIHLTIGRFRDSNTIWKAIRVCYNNKIVLLNTCWFTILLYVFETQQTCGMDSFYAKCYALHFALCYRSVCVCVCVYAAFVDLRKTVWDRDIVFFRLLEITRDITCKSFTQIELQIPRWRTKWRPWNTIFGRNSAIY